MQRGAIGLLLSVVIAVVVLTPRVVAAQVIRGTVTDVAGASATGAVVTLVRPAAHDLLPGTDLRTVLADATGTYSISTPGPGRYRIIVRRIGSVPFRSDVLTLADGETRRVDVRLEPISPVITAAVLPEIRVMRATPCRTDAVDAVRIATLWDDARTALLATEATRTGAVGSVLVRYARTLDPANLLVLEETLQLFDHRDVGNSRGFRSLPGDSLSTSGYWHRVDVNTIVFHGPDADALLSEAFVRDHCFNLVDSATETRAATGLLFEPIRSRTRVGSPPDIKGAIWFDAATSQLQRVEFNWVTLPGGAPTTSLGGQLNFAWSGAGAVHVDRWILRMPQDLVEIQGSLTNVTRTKRQRIVEEGGVVFVDSAATTAGSATITGDIRVGRRPLRGAEVRVLGTELTTVTDDEGRFAFGQVPAGLRLIIADHPSATTFGVRAAVLRVLLNPGEFRAVSLLALDQDGIAKALCGDGALDGGRSLLRVTVVDSTTAQPVENIRLRSSTRSVTTPIDLQVLTDARGAAVFCGVPPNQPLSVAGPDGWVLLGELSLGRGELASRQVRIRR